MSNAIPADDLQNLLQQFDLPVSINESKIIDSSGLSGSTIWRLHSSALDLALRAWPAGTSTIRLDMIGQVLLVARERGVNFLPAPLRSKSGSFAVIYNDRVYTGETWMSGTPLDRAPKKERIMAGCLALERFRSVLDSGPIAGATETLLATAEWSETGTQTMPVPNRWRKLAPAWQRRYLAWQRYSPLLADSANRDGRYLAQIHETISHVTLLDESIDRWFGRVEPAEVGWCHGDSHREHLLFEGNDVVGLIDFARLGLDSPHLDLARFLIEVMPAHLDEWVSLFADIRVSGQWPDRWREVLKLGISGIAIAGLYWVDRATRLPRVQLVPKELARWRALNLLLGEWAKHRVELRRL